MGELPRNIVASVHQRLLNEARKSGRPFNELLQYFAMERFLYRLSQSAYKNRFVLKGALMLRVWQMPQSRPTMDIDLLGKTANDIERIVDAMREVCVQDVESDGLVFDPITVQGTRIAENADYEGVRVSFRGLLGKARIFMQIDIGFGDVVSPRPVEIELPTILDFPAPKLKGYTRESAIAEKFHAMVKRGLLNSRMKDFYDIWMLSRQYEFDGATLATAIRSTFENRQTEIVPLPSALSPAFATDSEKVREWTSFARKTRSDKVPQSLATVVSDIATFLQPIAENITTSNRPPAVWRPPGPWLAKH